MVNDWGRRGEGGKGRGGRWGEGEGGRREMWLGSHVWHAKRMKMIKRWGYHFADHPADKSYRAGVRGAIGGVTVCDRFVMFLFFIF